MLRLAVAVACLAVTINAGSHHNTCYNSPDYNALGQAFVEAADNSPPQNCGHYTECWKAMGTGTVTEIDRWCPPGTMTDSHDIRHGAPCSKECDPNVCDCLFPTVAPIVNVTCPYVQMANVAEFALETAPAVMVGTCGEGGYFDDSDDICTCTTMDVHCTCKVALPLDTDILSHGCNGGWVGQAGMPTLVTVSNGMGQFTGWDSINTNGPHLATFVIDGMFAGGWVDELKLTASFNINAGVNANPWGIVDYGDCAGASAFGFSVYKDSSSDQWLTFAAEIETIKDNVITDTPLVYANNNHASPRFDTGGKFFASLTFKNSSDPSLNLYVMTEVQRASCEADAGTCPPAVASANPKGSVTPRGCGLTVGALNNGATTSFFEGEIGTVSVDIKPQGLMPCSDAVMH